MIYGVLRSKYLDSLAPWVQEVEWLRNVLMWYRDVIISERSRFTQNIYGKLNFRENRFIIELSI